MRSSLPRRAFTVTVNSFNAVSLDPPLILWSLSLYSPTLALFQRCSHYAVNILAADQVDLSNRFAASEGDKFSGLEVCAGFGGAPLLSGCCAWFECRNAARHAGGDHLIFVGLVERFSHSDRAPLIYHRGQYRALK
jgi:flavin reductase (DIM6/NTAB) family NADH-FMN oxidoreductase RutF